MGKNWTRKDVSIMIKEFVKATLSEDVGRGDLYALAEETVVDVKADIIAKCDGIVAGQTYIDALSELEGFELVWGKKDGESCIQADILAIIHGASHTAL